MAVTDQINISNLYSYGPGWDWGSATSSFVSQSSYGTIIELDFSGLAMHDRITKITLSASMPHVDGEYYSDNLIGKLFSSLADAKADTNPKARNTVALQKPNSYYGKFMLDFADLSLDVKSFSDKKLFIRIWAEDSSMYTLYRHSFGDYPAPQVGVEILSGCVKIKIGNEAKMAIPCIYTRGKWRQAIPYSYVKIKDYTLSQWHICT